MASLGNKKIKGNASIASFPLTVTVSNPKTESAYISKVETRGTSKRSPVFVGKTFFEPLAVGDGRLLIGRFGGSTIDWIDEDEDKSRKARQGAYDVVYSVYEGGSPCDASKWTNLFPISHAPHHKMVSSRYDFARHKFRDPTGVELPDGDELGITYPWMDHEAKNLVFTTISDTLFYTNPAGKIESRYPVACANSHCPSASPTPSSKTELAEIENSGATRGFTVMGAWTRGKMRLLDGMINRADFGLRTHPGAFRSVGIYRESGESGDSQVWVKVGANRDNTDIPGLDGYPGNTTFFDSITDRFFYSKNFKPQLSRDVVWTGSVGTMTDEISFDESLDNRLLLFADMNAALQFQPNQTQFSYFNGNIHNGKSSQEIRLQNVAASKPPYGVLTGGRVEPVALGGRFGRGVYLDSDKDLIKFGFNKAVPSPNLYLGLFVSPRGVGGKRQIFKFPNGSSLSIENGSIVLRAKKMGARDFSEQTISLPHNPFVNRQWVHLGLATKALPKTSNPPFQLDVYIDGMIIARQAFPTRPFTIDPGDLVIGGGFRGWYDEVRVMNALPNSEEACSFAYGTLGQIETAGAAATESKWKELAKRYPAVGHQEIRTELAAAGTRVAPSDQFVCLVNHNSRFGWSTALPKPATIKSYIRSPILMQSGEFKASLPRPDSRNNRFCRSCHEPAHLIPGLRVEGPLSFVANREMRNDRRKQPTQPIRIWGGRLPAGLLGAHGNLVLPAGGESVYRYIFPD